MKRKIGTGCMIIIVFVLLNFAVPNWNTGKNYDATGLPSEFAVETHPREVLDAGRTGCLTFGPYIGMKKGTIEIELFYKTDRAGNYVDVYSNSNQDQFARVELPEGKTRVKFQAELSYDVSDLEVRTNYGGEGYFKVEKIVIREGVKQLRTVIVMYDVLLALFVIWQLIKAVLIKKNCKIESAASKGILYILVLVIGGFYLWVLVLGSKPEVTDEYRLYYLEQQLSAWPGEYGLSYQYGTEDKFYSSDIHAGIRRQKGAWGEIEQDGCWTVGKEAKLFYRLETPVDLKLRIRCSSVILNSDEFQLQYQIYFNEHLLAEQQGFEEVIDLDIPKEAVKKASVNEIRFVVKNPVRPAEVTKSQDNRELGVKVKSIILERK